eukprot:scaffold11827_cov52-Phaeocystis_antarctica.AAC.3
MTYLLYSLCVLCLLYSLYLPAGGAALALTLTALTTLTTLTPTVPGATRGLAVAPHLESRLSPAAQHPRRPHPYPTYSATRTTLSTSALLTLLTLLTTLRRPHVQRSQPIPSGAVGTTGLYLSDARPLRPFRLQGPCQAGRRWLGLRLGLGLGSELGLGQGTTS